MSLTTLLAHSTWTSIATFYCSHNSLSIASIDAILIAFDATGATGGTLNYYMNPGSSDGDRSGAATTAKSNLVTKGWTITA